MKQEQLNGDIRIMRTRREEGPDLAASRLFHELDELRPHPVLEHRPRLAHLDEGPLGDHSFLDDGEAIVKGRYDKLRMDDRPDPIRSTPVVLTMERSDSVRDRGRLILAIESRFF